ncbi:MAG TPA: aminoglycoside adenylyltransferase domain-containing protein [Thermomicrobiales bacterium]|nr:aminoglycoside adenylyltransferase domain-containing protein [Thermomicrobiales bacterium]
MTPTQDDQVNDVIETLRTGMHDVLGDKLLGLYLFGSLVIGDFDPATSDIDLLAVLDDDVDDREFGALRELHDEFARNHPTWDDRIEVRYASVAALRDVTTRARRVVVISPGEPFHHTETRKDWVINLYTVQERGVTVDGRPPRDVVPPISREDFAEAIEEHARLWRTWVDEVQSQKDQAYAILTLCRTLYAHTNGDPTTKLGAAEWTQGVLPEWAPLIRRAVEWRRFPWLERDGPSATLAETRRFVETVLALVLGPVESTN